jgi:hypothetical protein
MSELLVALALAAALGAKPAPAPQHPQARARPPATGSKAQVANNEAAPKPHDARRAGAL